MSGALTWDKAKHTGMASQHGAQLGDWQTNLSLHFLLWGASLNSTPTRVK